VTDTAKIVARILRRREERKLRIREDKMSWNNEGQKDADSDITTNCGQR
jgi:hypothetical protein